MSHAVLAQARSAPDLGRGCGVYVVNRPGIRGGGAALANLRVGWRRQVEAVLDFLRTQHGVDIGTRTAYKIVWHRPSPEWSTSVSRSEHGTWQRVGAWSS